jgi:predicted nucleic acid-binding protein
MIVVVVDASVLVAELLRPRGRALLTHHELSLAVAEDQWEEAQHELSRRLDIIQSRGSIDADRRRRLEALVQSLIDGAAIQVVSRDVYEPLRDTALRRVPRDERDWPTVALAMKLNAAILTADNDFLGCGCPTWTVETLTDELRGD